MADFSELPKDMDLISFEIQANAEKRQREAALTITRELIQRNPKRTGRSAGNWNLSVNRPNYLVTEPEITEATQGVTAETLAQSQDAFVKKHLAEVIKEATTGKLRGDDPVMYITNPVSYVVLLNTTQPSRQADPGWVEASIRFGAKSTGVNLR